MAARGPGVWMLAVAQTLSYACLYYIFAALILAWEADLGWDRRLLALGPGIAIGISAVLAPLMGRAVDLGRGPEVMLAGAILGAVSLAGLAVGPKRGALPPGLGRDRAGAGGQPLRDLFCLSHPAADLCRARRHRAGDAGGGLCLHPRVPGRCAVTCRT